MAVEARHLNLFPPQILGNRGLMMNGVEGIGNAYAAPAGFGMLPPLSGTAMETMVPIYCSAIAETAVPKTPAIKSDSGLTYAAVPVSRKRSRDAANPTMTGVSHHHHAAGNRCGSMTFLGEDFSFHFQQQQLEIDRFIAQHTEKVRLEIEERRKRFSRRIAAAVEENVLKKLKAKEEEAEKIGKMNYALEERVKSLCVENQIWRDMAQANEATANALRSDLEQVLAQAQNENRQQDAADDDAESCCGSNDDEKNAEERRSRMCRSCGKAESCVLLLPCRHLCLCTVCGSSLHTCPVCSSAKTASVHVNLSAS
ncbi:probable BOI-related E3 ubiquitin-protein ligase 2 [Salvia hispanica]|uniref:probable BOI-related E3 ubiquitin-protein ligase 2 n=1 Tax=Salvia hispanica TaxID=49212 RepID=UPI002009D430|nr:probable BOI-related E3 ubiquitin-protein ligase 2 [Salvia hispanica]